MRTILMATGAALAGLLTILPVYGFLDLNKTIGNSIRARFARFAHRVDGSGLLLI